jgi:hypothetical protein
MNSSAFIARIALAWFGLLFFWLVVWSGMIGAPEWIWAIVAFLVLASTIVRAVTHVRRVRLIASHPAPGMFANRHRRQVEMPFPADEAFVLVEAAIRELPRVEDVESARDSLQVHARVPRINPYVRWKAARTPPSPRTRRNLVHATVSPGERTASVTLICEPEGAAWVDWFRVDYGTNLENIDAITRAISRRVSERRLTEETRARDTATEKELTVAKLSLLHAQVEPHFLYNTHASAQVLTRSDPAKADQMIGSLIAYLRRSLPRTDDSLSTVGEELELTRAYLDILRIRMGERLSLEVQVPDAVKGVPLPGMMLQTLAENAIKHGLEPVAAGGTIWISARVADEKVAITVADDGRGFSEDAAGTGIGLRNVRERLRLAYGEAASLAIAENFPRGVAATIAVPLAGPPKQAHA